MFMPGLGQGTMDGNGMVAVATQTAYGAATKSLVDNLQNFPGLPTPQIPVVTVCSANTPTGYRPSQIRVGTHADVQRRRQHQVAEAYALTAL
jgi:hypothetical protein